MFSLTVDSNDIVLAEGSNMSDPVVKFVLTSRKLELSGFLKFCDSADDEVGRDGDLACFEVSKSLKMGGAAGLVGVGASCMPAMRTSCAWVRGSSVGYWYCVL